MVYLVGSPSPMVVLEVLVVIAAFGLVGFYELNTHSASKSADPPIDVHRLLHVRGLPPNPDAEAAVTKAIAAAAAAAAKAAEATAEPAQGGGVVDGAKEKVRFAPHGAAESNDVPSNDAHLSNDAGLDRAPSSRNETGQLVIGPAKTPSPYLPPGEPLLNAQGEYIPLAERQDPRSLGHGVDGNGVFEEIKKEYLPFPELVLLTDLLKRWPPDNPDIPDIPFIRDGTLEVFNYSNMTERARADWLRWNEVPFKVTNVPVIDETVRKWSSNEYMINRFGSEQLKVTTSTTNHFRYYKKSRRRKAVSNFVPPTGREDMTFAQYLEKANESERLPIESPHYYVQLNSVGTKRWILDDLTIFRQKKSFFVADPKGNRGANCRYGARGIIASSHWDGGRNFVTILRGAKRYILLPPDQCPNLYLFPRNHPEGRHSRADWSQLNISDYPLMADARATEVVVSAGEMLYIPSYWFHYIVSTGVSFQCNCRSGNSFRMRTEVAQLCGDK